MESLTNLNDLRNGLHKRWVWRDIESYWRGMDCLQKINYSIQDLNKEIGFLCDRPMREVVLVISLVDWIYDAFDSILKLLRPDIAASFKYKDTGYDKKIKEYFKAIRSFVVAHPLDTNRHGKYGFDGDKICIDIRSPKYTLFSLYLNDENWFHLGIDGLQQFGKDVPCDFILLFYSKKMDQMKYFKYMGANYSDLYEVARVQIDKLYSLDKHLAKQKRGDYIKKDENGNDKT